jgi:hypothetical protein
MNLHVMRKLVIPGIAAGAIMAGAPTALAATSSAAVPARASAPAASAWYYYSNYPTYRACNSEGFYLEINLYAIGNYKCVETELDGYTTVWDLYYQLGHGPGS